MKKKIKIVSVLLCLMLCSNAFAGNIYANIGGKNVLVSKEMAKNVYVFSSEVQKTIVAQLEANKISEEQIKVGPLGLYQ